MKNQNQKKKQQKPKELRNLNKKISSPKLLLGIFEEYAIHAKASPYLQTDWVGSAAKEVTRKKERALTMVGFENYCFKMGYINDLKDYFANDDKRYNDYQPTCKFIKRMIEQDLSEGALAGIFNANLAARINGYTEKTQNENNNTNANYDITMDLGEKKPNEDQL